MPAYLQKRDLKRKRQDSTLPSSLSNVVPSCAQTCVKSFLDSAFVPILCASADDIQCLCSITTTSGYTLGEIALACTDSFCQQASDSTMADVYRVCVDQPGAAAATHSVLTLSTMAPTSTAAAAAVFTPVTDPLLLSLGMSSSTTTTAARESQRTDTAASTTSGDSQKSSNPGQTAGIVVAVLILSAALIAAGMWQWRKRKNKSRDLDLDKSDPKEKDSTYNMSDDDDNEHPTNYLSHDMGPDGRPMEPHNILTSPTMTGAMANSSSFEPSPTMRQRKTSLAVTTDSRYKLTNPSQPSGPVEMDATSPVHSIAPRQYAEPTVEETVEDSGEPDDMSRSLPSKPLRAHINSHGHGTRRAESVKSRLIAVSPIEEAEEPGSMTPVSAMPDVRNSMYGAGLANLPSMREDFTLNPKPKKSLGLLQSAYSKGPSVFSKEQQEKIRVPRLEAVTPPIPSESQPLSEPEESPDDEYIAPSTYERPDYANQRSQDADDFDETPTQSKMDLELAPKALRLSRQPTEEELRRVIRSPEDEPPVPKTEPYARSESGESRDDSVMSESVRSESTDRAARKASSRSSSKRTRSESQSKTRGNSSRHRSRERDGDRDRPRERTRERERDDDDGRGSRRGRSSSRTSSRRHQTGPSEPNGERKLRLPESQSSRPRPASTNSLSTQTGSEITSTASEVGNSRESRSRRQESSRSGSRSSSRSHHDRERSSSRSRPRTSDDKTKRSTMASTSSTSSRSRGKQAERQPAGTQSVRLTMLPTVTNTNSEGAEDANND